MTAAARNAPCSLGRRYQRCGPGGCRRRADRRQIRRPGVSGTSAGSIIGAIGPRHELTRSLWSAGGVQIAKNFSATTAWSREPSDGLDPPSRNRASGPRKRTRRRTCERQ